MSEYIHLIQAVSPDLVCPRRYRLGIACDPEGMARALPFSWPFAEFTLLHSIRSENRSSQLYRYLYRQFPLTCISTEFNHSFSWHVFAEDQIRTILSITTENFINLLPECSPVLTPPPSKIMLETLQERQSALLQEMENAEF